MNGFVMQETTFPYICAIQDDCSTDGEQQVICEFLSKEFDMTSAISYETDYAKIIITSHKSNINCTFIVYLLKFNHYTAKIKKGKYLAPLRDICQYEAPCEGDDYWTDSHKLQIQVEFLDENPKYSACAHQSEIIGNGSGLFWDEVPDTITMKDLTTISRLFHTASMIYRIKPFMDMPSPQKHVVSGDKLIILRLASIGPIKFMERAMCVYRKHNQGMSSVVPIKRLKQDTYIAEYMKTVCPSFPKYRYLSFLYGTFATYTKDVSRLMKVWYLSVSFVLSFFYFPENISVLYKKVKRRYEK